MRVPRRRSGLSLSRSSQKLLFLHIPKCGGTFVQETFSPYAQRCPLLTWPEAAGHLTYREYEPLFLARADNIQMYLILTVVRNPWAWHVSWYNYVRKDAGGKRSGMAVEHEQFRTMTFSDYLKWLDDESAKESEQGYIRKQLCDWIIDQAGRPRADIVLRQETLFADMVMLVNKLELAVHPVMRRLNVANEKDYRSFYNSEEIDQIARRHQRDLALFDYRFE